MRPLLGDLSISEGGNSYNTVGGLPGVSDPEQAYSQITRNEYNNYIRDYRAFEEDLINQSQNDTSLIDAAREDSAMAAGLAGGIALRNATRYGANLTPAQRQQQQAMLQRSNTLGAAQSINDARLAQKDLNTGLLADLVNIGQGVNRSSLSQLGDAANNAASRDRAYSQAKAQSKANTMSNVASLGAAAIMFMAF
jgi:hypothetical protein